MRRKAEGKERREERRKGVRKRRRDKRRKGVRNQLPKVKIWSSVPLPSERFV